jgi:hypothetical protein
MPTAAFVWQNFGALLHEGGDSGVELVPSEPRGSKGGAVVAGAAKVASARQLLLGQLLSV